MIKKLLTTSLVGLTLMMSGCGDDTEGEDRLGIQQMLDDGDFSGVIAKLEFSAKTKDEYISLGTAYMGKAGLSLTNIITSMVTSEGNSDNTFAEFVTAISKSSSISALSDLNKAIFNYYKVVGNACLNPNTLNNSQKDICLYIGLASTSSAAVTVDLIAGDLSNFGSNTGEDEKLSASICGMNYAFDRTATGCNVTESSSVNFTAINKTYIPLTITVDADTDAPKTEYHYLMNSTNQTVLTKGFCSNTSFSPRSDNWSDRLYACPINETAASEELTTAGVLVNVLNDGIGAIGGAVSDDMQGDINKFKCEIVGGSYDENNGCSRSIIADVSEQNIIDYLKKQN